MKKILVVDDEEKIRSIIRKYGEFEGYLIEEATDGMDAIQKVKENSNYDVIIMDVMMPELDGFSACTEIKKIKDIPVIMLSARGEEYDRIHGFEAGVDDYVIKPFSPRELMMRVKVVTSRVRTTEGQADILKYEGLEINFTARTVSIDGKRVEMSPKEYELLFYLAKNKNIALQRNQIITHVWGYDYYGDDRTLDTHIKLLRNSLGEYRKLLVTLRGIGYRFETLEDSFE
ncbi:MULTISPECIES: response regulator transcription factor [Pseudobutyrivibrio]|jgi:DNA-binding response OmpR family regulator|uniref:Stage 0 sporulation protein A homolog n=1 Tax=Pseudobutyrivibrio ruminis TaxID=46206 RepID=A0A2G3DS82_9FIRM|nr:MULTISPECIES: response regulator transcription factor [Pseudobutyrivibrio]PHU33899.1 DNA-binding response regulator [Pseudobutyrivibrio ruminis]PHU39593.1 DNA-binding response regulator [Pseudobutyrivibrio ruminis]SCY40592.1 DNA-binding response regulator, OmpR family, contains REC and winged-helix (wHTH) domain [Pseudobutyrivibrio sp. AR14]